MRSLEEILEELNAAESEYARKCAQYGIEEKGRSKKAQANDQISEEKA